MRKTILYTLLFWLSEQHVIALEVSRENTVDWVLVSSVTDSNSHMIQWKDPINPACNIGSPALVRTKFSTTDDAILSVLLTAKAANKKVGFSYNTTSTLDDISGHGVPPCQIVNAWLESE